MNFKKYIQYIKSIFGLSLSLAKAEFKLRNEGSYVGIFWYMLNPIIMFLSLWAIFSNRLGNGNIPEYPVYLLLGIIMFNFFQNTTTESTKIIMQNNGLIKSIKFPMESFILQIIMHNLFSHFFEILLFIAGMIILQLPLLNILFYFLILFFFCIFIFGFSLILASLSVYIIDLVNVWTYGARVIWLTMPIFYTIGGQTRLFYINLLNPVYYFITIARDIIIYTKMPEMWVVYGALGYTLIFFVAGVFIFNKLKSKFSELI